MANMKPGQIWQYTPTTTATQSGLGSVTWSGQATNTFPATFGNLTSTGPIFPAFNNVQPPPPMEASDVGITVDGLIVTVQGMKVRIPARLMQDLLTLSSMGLLDKLVPDEAPK